MADGRGGRDGGGAAEGPPRDRRVGGGLRGGKPRRKGRGPLITRRRVLALLGLGGAGLVGARYALPHVWRVPAPRELPPELAAWVEGLYEGIDRAAMWDVHCHVFGRGVDDAGQPTGSGCRVNPRVLNHLNVVERAQYDVFKAAAGVDAQPGVDAPASSTPTSASSEDAVGRGAVDSEDARYLRRLRELHTLGTPRGRRILLAFDHFVHPDGTVDPTVMPFHTPNAYVLELARQRMFEAGASIHPYRADAVERLDEAVAAGARLVKWLPAAMGMDPASPQCDPFYERLAAHGTPLLVHCGSEYAVSSAAGDGLGNPLRLRRALEAGVSVIVAHCASSGDDEDIDAPAGRRGRLPSFDLFLRLMGESRYERRLFGDISAITQANRCGRPLRTLLQADELHHRLLDGSDYPLPAIDPLVSTWLLVRRGYLSADQRELCNRVYEHNPLLFDFAVKRCLHVDDGGRKARFAPTVFETAWMFV